jgi:hypothetical protein
MNTDEHKEPLTAENAENGHRVRGEGFLTNLNQPVAFLPAIPHVA